MVLVHGVSGSASTTWRLMMHVLSSDHELKQVTLDCYDYPTALFHLPWNGRFANLRELALGLKTHLETRHSQSSEITLVGHSLGGLVARQYIVNEMKAGRAPLCAKLILYAVPNTGASLAAIATKLSWNHRHLKPICRGSDVLEILNEDWITLNVEDRLKVRYVVGGADGIVTATSARPFAGRDNVSTLIGYDHNTIIQPTNIKDLRYAVLKQFSLGSQDSNGASDERGAGQPPLAADPLFDIFTAKDELYYLERPIDGALKHTMSARHVWLSGASGTGKTTALRRCALSSGWHLHQIMLGSYQGRDAVGLIRGICAELADIPQIQATQPSQQMEIAELISYLKTAFRRLPGDRPNVILIEEIPVGHSAEFAEFLRHLLMIVLAIDADPSISGRIQLAFSSIADATQHIKSGMPKLRERIQFLPFSFWTSTEVTALVDLLRSVTYPKLTDSQRAEIVSRANGLPRYVKMFFRHLINRHTNISFEQLLSLVAAEQV